jgi:hypothetical protein
VGPRSRLSWYYNSEVDVVLVYRKSIVRKLFDLESIGGIILSSYPNICLHKRGPFTNLFEELLDFSCHCLVIYIARAIEFIHYNIPPIEW